MARPQLLNLEAGCIEPHDPDGPGADAFGFDELLDPGFCGLFLFKYYNLFEYFNKGNICLDAPSLKIINSVSKNLTIKMFHVKNCAAHFEPKPVHELVNFGVYSHTQT